MFVLSERSRRRYCRASFVALCLAPTVALMVWIVMLRLPSRHAAVEQALSSRLGVRVTLGTIATPQPGVTCYHDVVLSEPDGRGAVLQADRIGVHQGESGQIVTVDGARLLASGTSGPGKSGSNKSVTGPGLWPLLKRFVQINSESLTQPIEINADGVALEGLADNMSLAEVKSQFDPLGDEPSWTVGFHLAGRDPSARMQLRIFKRADGRTIATFDTGGAELPATVAALVLPSATGLGPAAKFRGSLRAELKDDDAAVELKGQVSHVELQSLAGGLMPEDRMLRGRATLTLDECRILNGRIERATGRIQSDPGLAGPRFLDAAAETLRLVTQERGRALRPEPIPFDRLAFDFSLNAEGVRISSLKGTTPANAIMTGSAKEVLLSEGSSTPQPPTALARLLSPETSDWVPATAQSQWLLARLPIVGPAATIKR